MTTRPARARTSRIVRLATLSAALALPFAAGAASPDAAVVLARATVPDELLEPMRGGLDLGSMIARFAIERVVRVDGEVVARTQLMVDRLDGLSRGQLPDARLIGNLANLVQIGENNRATNAPPPSSQQTPPAPPATPTLPQQPTSSGTVSTPNTASGMGNDWGSMLSQAVALATGDESNRPTPVDVGAVPAASAGTQSGNAGPSTSPVSPGTPSASPAAPPPGGQATGSAPSTAGGIPVMQPVAPIAVPEVSITVPIGSGRSIVVSGIPNGPALATSIQNSVQATRIETETRIDAALSSLSALRSLNFANQLRQQAIDAATR